MGSENYLGVIPVGTGNDFYKSILKQNTQMYEKIDVAQINDNILFIANSSLSIFYNSILSLISTFFYLQLQLTLLIYYFQPYKYHLLS